MDKRQNSNKPRQGYQFASKLLKPPTVLSAFITSFSLTFIGGSMLCYIGDAMPLLDFAKQTFRDYFLLAAVTFPPYLSVSYLLLKSPLGKHYQYASRQKKMIVEFLLFCLLLAINVLLLWLSGFLNNTMSIIFLCLVPSIFLLAEMLAQSN